MDLSIVIPLFNEDESLPELSAWIEKVMMEHDYSYEIIFVDDGSTDNSWQVVEDLRMKNHNIKGIKFQRNYGKSAGLNEAFRAASGGGSRRGRPAVPALAWVLDRFHRAGGAGLRSERRDHHDHRKQYDSDRRDHQLRPHRRLRSGVALLSGA